MTKSKAHARAKTHSKAKTHLKLHSKAKGKSDEVIETIPSAKEESRKVFAQAAAEL
jgi:hypothetical protein